VGDDPALQELSLVAGALARRYRWKETEATVLVLTALFPKTPPPVLATLHESSHYPRHKHIVLEIDATLSPADVAEVYRME
jgi:hypothetical protein